MVKIKRCVLLVGDSGTSKTATISNFLKHLSGDSNVSQIFRQVSAFTALAVFDVYVCRQITLTINLSSRTTSMDLQKNLEANIEKRTKDVYGPPVGKRLLIYIDDMNMPKVFNLL